MQEEKERILNSNAHKYFWLYVVVFLMIAAVMILFSSYSQERLKMEKEQISEQLTEEKNFSKGIQKTARDISEQNDTLKQENKELQEKITALEQEVEQLKKDNHNYQKTMDALKKLKEAYVAGDLTTCQSLLEEIDQTLIPQEEKEQFLIILQDLT